MAQIYSAIANGGTLYRPEIARAILKPDGTVIKEFKPVVTGKAPLTPAVTTFLHNSLRSVATSGTAASVFAGFPVHVAGKTGTGQDLGRNANGSAKDDTAWFASFAPVENPQYAVVVMVSQGGFGASAAAPGVKDIYSALFGVTGGGIDPTKGIFPKGVPDKLPKVDPKNAKLVTK
jgi:penicillin-binding protein 2